MIIGSLVVAVALYSCGNSGNSSAFNEDSPVSNNQRPPVLMDGSPVPPAATPALASSSTADTAAGASSAAGGAIDIDAPSDSKGVGKFTSVKVGATVDKAMAAKGKELFQTSCTACHMTTDKRLVGPGLKGITKIRTPEWIMNMITNPLEMTHKDPVAEALLADFNNIQMTNQNVGDDGARSILEFLRQNDGVK